MAEATNPETATPETPKPAKKAPVAPARPANWGRKRIKTEGRKKRRQKLATDRDFAKAFFDAKSKRSTERKSAFRKKKRGKK